jgi:hypothetical protein
MAEYVRSGGWLTIIDARVKILKWPRAKRRTTLIRGRDPQALPLAARLAVTMASPAVPSPGPFIAFVGGLNQPA